MLEMLVLILIALVVFGYVLVPMVRPQRRDLLTDDEPQSATADDEEREVVRAANRSARDTS